MSSPWLRRAAIGVGALALLLVAAALVLVATFDANRYKGLAIDWMQAQHQRRLSIDGPIGLSLFPRVAVTLSRLRLSERGRDEEFAAIDEAALAVRTLPLLRGQLVIDRIAASGVRAAYLRDVHGQRNVDDFIGPSPAAPGGPSGGGPAAPGLRFDVSAIKLDDLRLRVQDQMAGLAGEFVVQSFTSGRLADQQEAPVALRATVQLTQPQSVQVAVDAGMNLRFDLDQGSVAIGALKFVLTGRQEDEPFELALDWPQLKIDKQQFGGSAVTGRFKLGGATALAGDFSAAAPSGNFDTLRLPGVKLDAEVQAGGRRVKGSVSTDLLVHVGRGAAALDRLVAQATVAEPGLQPLQLTAQGSAGADAKTVQWQLSGALNANRFDIKGQASFAGRTPAIRVAAHFDSLDVNKLLAPGKPTPTTTATAAADTPVPLDALKVVDGEITFDAAALAFRQYRFSDAKFAATLDKGRLQISRLAGRAWGGSISASGSADANSARVGLKLDADGVDVKPLLKDVADKDLLEGSGHVAADLQSGGKSVGALRSNLAGTVAVQLRNGAIKGMNLARALRQAQAALSLRKDAVTQASSTEKTDFSELNATARVAGGVARSDDLDVKSPFLRISGAGSFDIGRGRVDYTARAAVTGSATGQGGSGLEALRGLTVPVRLEGPFSAIDWKVQWSEIASSVVKGKVKDALTDKLKGLLR